jgi:diguanylate cyclase (GGDEF)-like protein
MEAKDHLTGLFDRKALDQQLRGHFISCSSAGLPFAVLMADIDRFKKVNDSFGHAFGDTVLKSVASTLSSVTSGKGYAYRYGGEEVTVLLPNHTTHEAIAVAERIRRSVESSNIEGKTVTISIGVSNYPDHATEPNDLLKLADEALYNAKNHGRNLVRVYGEPEPSKGDREPERKKAEAGKLTENQKREIKLQHFRGYRVRCPEDNALLKVIVGAMTFDQQTPGMRIICPFCGLEEDIE